MGMGQPGTNATPNTGAQGASPTQSGFGTLSRPANQPAPNTGGLGALQQFGQQGGFGSQFSQFNPQGGFGGFGQMNPQMAAWRNQMEAWRGIRPDMQPGMDRDAFHQQMENWRGLRPELNRTNGPAPQFTQAQLANMQPSDGANLRPLVQLPANPQTQVQQPAPDPQAAALYQQYMGLVNQQPAQIQSIPPMMPPAPMTQQIGREDPRMVAMRNMQRRG